MVTLVMSPDCIKVTSMIPDATQSRVDLVITAIQQAHRPKR